MTRRLIITAFSGAAGEARRDVVLTARSEEDENAMRDALSSRRIDEAVAFPDGPPVAIPAGKVAQSLSSAYGQRQVAKIGDPELRASLDELRRVLEDGAKAAVARAETATAET